MSYLLDTNVLSEATKPRPDKTALAWLEAHEDLASVSAVSLGEIWKGIELLPNGRRRRGGVAIQRWERVRDFDFQLTMRGLRLGRGGGDGIAQNLAECDGRAGREERVLSRPGVREHLLDHLLKLLGVLRDEPGVLADALRLAHHAALEIVRRAADDGERREQFVRDGGDKIHLRFRQCSTAWRLNASS